jgi:2-polyprenyl-3-methyl-5-hydroxy-6-metoxy-1,4-benzoquinol methylase
MHYDPIKDTLGSLVRRSPLLRKLFYKALGAMFLREWYVKRKIKSLYSGQNNVRGGQNYVLSLREILDAGSGFGQYSYFMAKRFPDAKINAVDVKEDQISDSKYFFSKCGLDNCSFSVGDLTKIEDENKYDFILSVDVMEHIEDDTGVFKHFYRSLKPGGRVLINTPSNLGGSDAHSGEDESFIGEHVRNGYSKEEICGKLQQAGFEIESFEYTYGKWGSRYWKLGIKYPMLMLNKSKLLFVILPFYYLFTIWFVWLFMKLDVNEKDKSSGTGILVVGKK